eukprot:9082333-Pyramimonas_sp.AAC.1
MNAPCARAQRPLRIAQDRRPRCAAPADAHGSRLLARRALIAQRCQRWSEGAVATLVLSASLAGKRAVENACVGE